MLMTLPVLMIWMMLNRVLMTRQVMLAAQKFTFPTATDWPFLSKKQMARHHYWRKVAY
jgi:hypothetical protein